MNKEKENIEIKGPYSINGVFEVPGDKSISHRAVIISSLTKQKVIIDNFLLSQDCIRTLDIIEKLGVKYILKNTCLSIHGCGIESFQEPDDILYVGNSGTSIRLLAGILSTCDFLSVLSGDASINNRPMDRIINPLREMGAAIFGRACNNKAPLVIFGNRQLKGKVFMSDISSAQVKSCLLFAGLFAEGITEVRQPSISRDHTERMLEYFGAEIDYKNGKNVKINKSTLKGRNLYVPGDFSSAAFFIIAALILDDSEIIIKNLGINPTRAYLLEILKEMGGKIEVNNYRNINNEPVADLKVSSSNLKAIEINKKFIANIIDEIPILSVACAFASGNTLISGAEELRIKESDRIKAIVNEFNKVGIKTKENKDGLVIYGNKDYDLHQADIESYGDHRIAMALSIAALKGKKRILIKDSRCINTSFPGFKELLFRILN
ncbi:MAG: 3-phosphoshikimate 1-carboxyvinyltransferase [Actinomycetota bacterium]|nr:3-phosphoshikimate 1-carboxyvinyltransferase [Actinomycetota bacterium]